MTQTRSGREGAKTVNRGWKLRWLNIPTWIPAGLTMDRVLAGGWSRRANLWGSRFDFVRALRMGSRALEQEHPNYGGIRSSLWCWVCFQWLLVGPEKLPTETDLCEEDRAALSYQAVFVWDNMGHQSSSSFYAHLIGHPGEKSDQDHLEFPGHCPGLASLSAT